MPKNDKRIKVRLKKNSEFKIIKNFHHFLIDEFIKTRFMLVEIQSLQNNGTDLIIKNALIEYTIIKTVSIFENFLNQWHFVSYSISQLN